MKKIGYLLLVLTCVLALTACGGEKKEQTYELGDVQAIVDAGAFSEELEQLDGDTAFGLYGLADAGLNREELTDCDVVRSAGGTCEEGAVLLFANQEQAGLAAQALDDYLAGQIEGNVDYRPSEIPKLENALVSQRGSTLLLVVANDLEAAKKAVE